MSVANTALTKICSTCGYRLESTLERCPIDSTRLGRERPELMVLGAYRLVERIGTGGMGVVYRGIHEKLGRTVAIKMMHRSLVSDRTTVVRFFQEARSVNTIRHPNVVDVYDFVSADKDIYLVMEFLVGEDLHQLLYEAGGRPLPLKRLVKILEQVCGGLQAAHTRNLIHRDLKPANVFLTRQNDSDDFVKLLDFGLAKLERTEGRMTRDGAVLGTPEYMSPEQATGQTLDGRADLYAVGCIAYEMFTGCRLFVGGGHADVMVRHVNEAPVPPRRWNPELPEALEKTLLRCLAKQPSERPDTAMNLAKELCAAIDQPFDTTGAFMTTRPLPVLLGPGGIDLASPGREPDLERDETIISRPNRTGLRLAMGCLAVAAVVAGAVVAWPLTLPRKVPVAQVQAPPARPTGPTVDPIVDVRLQSIPAGARIVKTDGTTLGETPHDLWVPLGSEQQLRFEMEGFHPKAKSFRVDGRTTIVVELEADVKPIDPVTRLTTKNAPAPRVQAPHPSGKRRPAKTSHEVLKSREKTINPFSK